MNVQQIIIKGIKEQLFGHNYLVLPGFGGFVLKSRPSHFSASGGSLLPPSKTLGFNSQLKQNDGIMVFWLQQRLNCSAQEALTHLTEFTAFCSGVLTAKRRLTIDGLGFFYVDFENNICFEPQQDANFLSDSFGLMPLSLRPIEATETTKIKESDAIKTSLFVDRKIANEEIPTTITRSKRHFKQYINPLIVAALSISLLILIITNSRSSGVLYASMFGTSTSGLYTPQNYSDLALHPTTSSTTAYVADANGIATLALTENKVLSVMAIENKGLSSVNHLNYTSKQGYEIVLGCFTVRSNAERMNKGLIAQNIRSSISPKNNKGMYVISDGNYRSKEEAIQRLQEIKVLFPKAWIKKAE